MNKKDSKKKQFVIFGICSALALVLCMVTLVVTVQRVESSNPTEQSVEKVSKTILKNDTASLTQYILRLTQGSVSNEFIKADFRTEVAVDDASIKINGESADSGLLVYMKNKVISSVDAVYGEDFKGTFGSISEGMPLVDLSGFGAVECVFSQGQQDEAGSPVVDDEGNIVDADFYFLTFIADGKAVKGAQVERAFSVDAASRVTEGVRSALLPDCNISFNEIQPLDYTIKAKVNRFTDELVYIEIQRAFSVNADVEFLNNMSVFGKKNVEFNFSVKEIYDYKYAGITFLSDSFKAEAGDEISLAVNAVIEDESDYEVRFISSDESIATVDEMGYVQVLKAEPVAITVELTYLGKVFTDECSINAPSAEG